MASLGPAEVHREGDQAAVVWVLVRRGMVSFPSESNSGGEELDLAA